MRFVMIFAFLVAVVPVQLAAKNAMTEKDYLTENELKFLFRTCLESFFQPGGQPYKLDRKRLQAMGMTIEQDENHHFTAAEQISSGIYSLSRIHFGPRIEIDRNKRKPNKLLHKDCEIRGSSAGFSNETVRFTNVNVEKGFKLLVSEVKRMGFKSYQNQHGDTIWRKGDIAISVSVSFHGSGKNGGIGALAPNSFSFSGVHPKRLK